MNDIHFQGLGWKKEKQANRMVFYLQLSWTFPLGESHDSHLYNLFEKMDKPICVCGDYYLFYFFLKVQEIATEL